MSSRVAMIVKPELRAVAERQLAEIQESHARIKALRDQAAPPPPATPGDRRSLGLR